MDAQVIHDLVHEASGELVDTGCFPANWFSDYESAIEYFGKTFDDATWPKQWFLFLHFASTHLCLRYKVWNTSSNQPNLNTESILQKVQSTTEELFWTSLAQPPSSKKNIDCTSKEHSLCTAEQQIIELCFGKVCPIIENHKNSSNTWWKNEYEASLRKIEKHYTSTQYWPKWICMAIHFASFYIDLFHTRTIKINKYGSSDLKLTPQSREVLVKLNIVIENEAVLDLIKLWLSSTEIDRDSSGLPKIGELRPHSNQTISVRTSSELFLQMCAQNRTLDN